MKNFVIIISLFLFFLTQGHAVERTIIKINLSEMLFQVEGQAPNTPVKLKVGQDYKLIFENLGFIRHEILFGRGIEGDEAEEYLEKFFTNFKIAVSGAVMVNQEKRIWEVETNDLEEIELDPGVRVALFFRLPESAKGEWEIGCFMPGHFQMGMKLPMIVE